MAAQAAGESTVTATNTESLVVKLRRSDGPFERPPGTVTRSGPWPLLGGVARFSKANGSIATGHNQTTFREIGKPKLLLPPANR